MVTDNSEKAQFGRSKEKRSDCKLLVRNHPKAADLQVTKNLTRLFVRFFIVVWQHCLELVWRRVVSEILQNVVEPCQWF